MGIIARIVRFARSVRFFNSARSASVMVRTPCTSESQAPTPSAVEAARFELRKKRAKYAEGSWGETQFHKLD